MEGGVETRLSKLEELTRDAFGKLVEVAGRTPIEGVVADELKAHSSAAKGLLEELLSSSKAHAASLDQRHQALREEQQRAIAALQQRHAEEVARVRQQAIDDREALSARVDIVAGKVEGERLDATLRELALRAADAALVPVRDDLDSRLKRLGSAYDHADEVASQLRGFLEDYAPGGAPVLRQEVDEQRKLIEALREQLRTTQADEQRVSREVQRLESELQSVRLAGDRADPKVLAAREKRLLEQEAALGDGWPCRRSATVCVPRT